MLTFFSIPKPFRGHIGIIQKNAIESWRRIDPTCDILLFGDEEGTEEVAREFKVYHIPDIVKNEFGTPLLNDVFMKARNLTRHRLLCYANADVILFQDLVRAVKRVQFKNFLMAGRRWNLGIKERLDYAFDDWQQRLVKRVNEYGVLDSVWAMDYFVFPTDSEQTTIPAFAVGRPGWDNWFIFRARELRIPVIDATKAVLAVHQKHDYNHVPFRRADTWEGPEADRNWELVGDFNKDFNLMDATHVITERGVASALTFPYLRRRWQKMTVLRPHYAPIIRPLSRALNILRGLRTG